MPPTFKKKKIVANHETTHAGRWAVHVVSSEWASWLMCQEPCKVEINVLSVLSYILWELQNLGQGARAHVVWSTIVLLVFYLKLLSNAWRTIINDQTQNSNSNVQEHWNCLENIIVNSVDQIAPLINVGSMQRPVLASQSCDYLSYYFVF